MAGVHFASGALVGALAACGLGMAPGGVARSRCGEAPALYANGFRFEEDGNF
jgi:hypothetical protein